MNDEKVQWEEGESSNCGVEEELKIPEEISAEVALEIEAVFNKQMEKTLINIEVRILKLGF